MFRNLTQANRGDRWFVVVKQAIAGLWGKGDRTLGQQLAIASYNSK